MAALLSAALWVQEVAMTLRVLQMLAKKTLPHTVTGHDAIVVASMVAGGWVKATMIPDDPPSEEFCAVVHEITALGRRQLDTFR